MTRFLQYATKPREQLMPKRHQTNYAPYVSRARGGGVGMWLLLEIEVKRRGRTRRRRREKVQ
jgi:hypothetical protein